MVSAAGEHLLPPGAPSACSTSSMQGKASYDMKASPTSPPLTDAERADAQVAKLHPVVNLKAIGPSPTRNAHAPRPRARHFLSETFGTSRLRPRSLRVASVDTDRLM